MSYGSMLLVDDDRQVLEAMTDWLIEQGIEVDPCVGYVDALSRLGQKQYDLMLADIRLQDGDGFDLLEQSIRRWPTMQVILMTGYGTADSAIDAIRAGAFDYLTKPLIDDELLMSIERAMAQRQVIDENTKLKAELDRKHGMGNIVGQDPRMLRVFDVIESVADTRATILVTGESGTGKSMIARAIHRRSERRGGPFVEVACGALPENLLESELFGHVAGAFTGAVKDKAGKFLQANGGTIFLDEIGTATPAMQVKLLRVLQELAFEPVGGSETFKVDVRVILATNENLAKNVAEGKFRQDLYYRINVINLELPPLRGRVSDIPTLAQKFLEEVREDANRPHMKGFTDDALTAMQKYPWPGNVRELQNVVERAVLLGKQEYIGVNDLPLELRSPGGFTIAPLATGSSLKGALKAPERQLILEVLEANGWSRTATANALGINRTTLYKKMKRLGLEDQAGVK